MGVTTTKKPVQTIAPKAAPVAAAAGEDAAGKKAKREKKEKKVRADYAGTAAKTEDGLLTELPTDFDSAKNKPLKRGDFKDEALFFDWKAAQADKAAARYREEAKAIRAGGGTSAKETKKLVAMTTKLEEMKKTLAAKGIDVAALLASMAAE